MTTQDNNSRNAKRADLDLYVNKIVGDEPHMVRVRDISTTGIFLYKLIEPTNYYGHVGLEIMLPESNELIWALGEVVREDDEAVAVRFVRIAEHHKEMISKYIGATPAQNDDFEAETAIAV